ncbi:uncharacterized protein LOC128680587 isoform X2 [Plodia interpunctella]|nr:uncharacterized protein LOC128680587 isoform X2 [Plodia interpunctella]
MTPSSPVIIYLLMSVVSANDDNAYCAVRYSRLCQEKGLHIGCQYPDPGPGESCEKYTKIAFTDDLKNFILNYINRRRQKIAAGHEKVRGGLPIPKPDIMMYVEWDRELAHLAQRLADQCRFVHDECRATVRYPYPGQTVGEVRWRRSHDSDQITAQKAIRKVFDAWWGEKRRVQPQQLTTPFRVTPKGTVWGHFSQLAIWKLRAIGCGAVHHGPPHPRLLLVCDYSHTNMLGQKTISAGPLATCPPHTTRLPRSQFPLLCTTIKYPRKLQDLDSLYDYENQDSRESKEQSLQEEDERFPPLPEEDPYKERPQQNIDENEMSHYDHKKSTTSVEGLNDIRSRNQIKIFYGPYEPTKTTTKRTHDPSEYEERKYVEDRVNNGHSGNFYEKRPQNSEDYSVIPLRSRPWGNDVESPPWRPQMFRRTSTTLSEYETSIVYIPKTKNRTKITEAQSKTSDEIHVRRQHKDSRRIQLDIAVREKASTRSNRRPLAPSLKLDKEDIEQLFKDTGFKPNWTPTV